MVNEKQILELFAALAMPAAFAGMYDQPYAIFESGGSRATQNEESVSVTKVDGKSRLDPRGSGPLAPGRHVITVERAVGKPRDIEIEVQACTRYRIVAVPSRMDWDAKIYSEPIGECVRKFKK